MEYQKPELNQLGAGESLVLGGILGGRDSGTDTHTHSAFEFEE
jgi:hypothetical protein